MKRMLFNATHAEEFRVAIVDGQKLVNLDLESAIRYEKKGNIYKGVVTKVEPSLEACFVDYGAEKQGFLPLKEIYRQYFGRYDSKTPISSVKIESVIREGQEMILQVDKDERGSKGAALTTFVSLAGRFLVLMPNNPKGGGISRRVVGEERAELKEVLSRLKIDPQHSLIARTEGIGRSQEELQWDLDFLLKLWETIEQASVEPRAPFLIYQESNLIVRSIRDHLSQDIGEIIVDDEEIYERARRFITQVMPQSLCKLKLYKDSVPLFSRYQIEGQIESAFNREVGLSSGGSISVDHTEALIAIDVNSARATKGGDIEETALQTNLEAVEEAARQLKIRDMGGLIVIDLIDMTVSRNQRAVESRLKDALQADRARVQVGHISRFGLLEMSRQRLRSSINETNYRTCPRCEGTGTIRSVVSSSLNFLRIIEDEALKENTEAIQAVLPLDMATYLLNEKRYELSQLESRLASRIIIIPVEELASPHFQIKRLRSDQLDQLSGIASYKQSVEIENSESHPTVKPNVSKPAPALVQLDQIGHAIPPPASAPAPRPATRPPVKPQPGLFRRLWRTLFGVGTSPDSLKTGSKRKHSMPSQTKNHSRSNSRGNNQPNKRQHRDQSKGQSRGSSRIYNTRNQAGKTGPGSGAGNGRANPNRDNQSTTGSRPQQSRSNNPNRSPRPKRPANNPNRNSVIGQPRTTPSQDAGQPRHNYSKNRGNPVRPNRRGETCQQKYPQSQSIEQGAPVSPTRNQSPGGRGLQNPNPQHSRPIPTGPIENITQDLPDDIGNRKD